LQDHHLAAYPQLVYFTNVYHMYVSATSWERFACRNIGHLSDSHRQTINVAQVKGIVNLDLRVKSRFLVFPRFAYV